MRPPINIEPVAGADLSPELSETLRPRIERLGYLGEFFTCAAHQPEALLSFIGFTEALKASVATNHTELVALTVATAFRNDYERHQHERLATKLGFTRDWVADVERLAPEAAGALSDTERRVQVLVLAMLADQGRLPRDDVRALAGDLGEAETVGLLMLTGRYAAHALISNAFGVRPPVPSIFDGEDA